MNRKGFTLIELMIVIAIIAIIAAIAIPGILAARRSANANAAMGNLKSFSTAMTVYQQKNAAQLYPPATGTAPDFTGDVDNTYSHLSPKGGYYYQYYTAASTQYMYVAYPTSYNNGVKLFVVDETNSLWENALDTTKAWIAPTCTIANANGTNTTYPRVTGTNLGVWTQKS
jgi:prepilin-type N-terminal cleavage/methylation domain-containing protein